MHSGSDTRYYLSKGFRVLAIDADPSACESAEARFAQDIAAGRLHILNAGIAPEAQTLDFYRCINQPAFSTFVREKVSPGHQYETLTIPCRSLSSILEEHGVPYYMKIDIEGMDESVVRTLTPGLAPPYISVELSDDDQILEILQSLGYHQFKIINQQYHTSSLPIFRSEVGWRLLRKISIRIAVVHRAIQSLPFSLRPKCEWDTRYNPDGLGKGSLPLSGPFGEAAHGPWIGFPQARRIVERVRREFRGFWWDIHARRA
jgi:FkbM family methyltransferase